MRIPELKVFLRSARGPNAGSMKYLNLSSTAIGPGGPKRCDMNGMLGCGFTGGTGGADGASGKSGCWGAEDGVDAEVV